MIAQQVPGATVASGRRGILVSERKLLLAAGDTILVAPGALYGAAGERHVRVALTATDERVAAAAERIRALR